MRVLGKVLPFEEGALGLIVFGADGATISASKSRNSSSVGRSVRHVVADMVRALAWTIGLACCANWCVLKCFRVLSFLFESAASRRRVFARQLV